MNLWVSHFISLWVWVIGVFATLLHLSFLAMMWEPHICFAGDNEYDKNDGFIVSDEEEEDDEGEEERQNSDGEKKKKKKKKRRKKYIYSFPSCSLKFHPCVTYKTLMLVQRIMIDLINLFVLGVYVINYPHMVIKQGRRSWWRGLSTAPR